MSQSPFTMTPIGVVRAARAEPMDDEWDSVLTRIELDGNRFTPEALEGLDGFSHVEVITLFHLVDEGEIEMTARHPRGRSDWPKVGIFAQRGKGRPNRLGATIARLDRVEGLTLHVTGLDAIEGTPVLDVKPVMSGFLPRGAFREPDWAREIMATYWSAPDEAAAPAYDPLTDIAFTPAVKRVQEQYGTRANMRQLEESGRWLDHVTDNLAAFLASRESCYLGTASRDGRPYIQHRGGPAGFIKIQDAKTLVFPDYPGNQQLISAGNLSENDQAFLFFPDYENRQRIKIWGRARVVPADAELARSLAHEAVRKPIHRAMIFTVEAWDTNCPQYIPRMIREETVIRTLAPLQARIEALEGELARLKGAAD